MYMMNINESPSFGSKLPKMGEDYDKKIKEWKQDWIHLLRTTGYMPCPPFKKNND